MTDQIIKNHPGYGRAKETGPALCKSLYLMLFALFAVSGAAGLIYEVIWVRQLTLVLGASSYAVTLVLVAFMGGLGLGAWLIGRTADRLQAAGLVKAYALLELGIALYALLFPTLLAASERVYVHYFQTFAPSPLGFHLFKLALAGLLLLIPTVLMGATLPVLSRYLIRKRETAPSRVSWLYAVNTLGAATGALAAGYLLLPLLGIRFSTGIAVALNLAAALGLYIFHLLVRSGPTPFARAEVIVDRRQKVPMSGFQWAVTAGFALSGTAAMFYQVAWTRTLSMVLGTTTFAFTTMLTTFLVGIAVGSLSYGLWARLFSRTALFVFLQLTAAFSALLTIPLFESLPVLYLSLHDNWVSGWLGMQILQFTLAALVMLIPTFALGAMFPVVSNLLIDHLGHLGQRIGRAYALNTLGAVIGAAVAGLLLVPLIGMQQTLIFGALLNLAGGLAIWLLRQESPFIRRLAGCSAMGLLALVAIYLIQPWAPRVINSGVYLYADRYQAMEARVRQQAREAAGIDRWELWEMAMKQYDLLYYNPGITATVAVMERSDGVRFLTINGKTDASTGEKSDMRTQVMIGQLPLLLHENPEKVLVVGLGSSVTAGAALSHAVERVDVAEISPGVIEAAGYFQEASQGALDDPRLRLIPRDARNHLLTSDETYDVIISQPSNPWIKGEASLFTEEWYAQVDEHLGPRGLFVQWVPSYLMADRDLKVIAHTLRSVFPHLTVWRSGSVGDLIFLAQKGAPLEIDFERYLQKIQRERVAADIERVGLDPAELLLTQFSMGEKELVSYLYSDPGQVLAKNTDNWSVIEFTTPKQLIRGNSVERFVDPEERHFNLTGLSGLISTASQHRFQRHIQTLSEHWSATSEAKNNQDI